MARSAADSSWTASAGSSRPTSAVRNTATRASLDFAADELPRSNAALPDLSVSPKASTVTLGRPS
ncbi:Uncharacterised protein [Mycobacterium tuberculosis]|uniref:Uncharacterized protein n=1 Tax=Mycobacterium tuberculosis TaxID=1773 RepID=A0A655JNK5_MYCTX|nr:Uncharacterised protein [Mycobacterium tuberculosis]CKS79642.1 Uncharacterised protein [Mycobacterium tuberculosis]CNM74900.1 Uncharacterised protein [Mycobacterium tuberculosis]CNV84654.1 Uncharacterised protein [Mycobacterium tuberculosis]CNW09918.1 Uncharacterised protein [Mycobacterium tuberculosis]